MLGVDVSHSRDWTQVVVTYDSYKVRSWPKPTTYTPEDGFWDWLSEYAKRFGQWTEGMRLVQVDITHKQAQFSFRSILP